MDRFQKKRGSTPPTRWLRTQMTRLCFYYVGKGIETAYNHLPDIREELDALPDPFSFSIGVANGPSMLILKKGSTVRHMGEKESYRVDLEMEFRHIVFAYLAMTGRISTPEAAYHNRILVRGDLGQMMVMVRVMNAAQMLLFPSFLLRFYLKEVPPLTFRMMIDRVKAHTNALAGFFM